MPGTDRWQARPHRTRPAAPGAHAYELFALAAPGMLCARVVCSALFQRFAEELGTRIRVDVLISGCKSWRFRAPAATEKRDTFMCPLTLL